MIQDSKGNIFHARTQTAAKQTCKDPKQISIKQSTLYPCIFKT